MRAISRRRFVQGLAASAASLGMGFGAARNAAAASGQPTLRGRRFELRCHPLRVNITGRPRFATAINGSVPGPVLRWREGDEVSLRVRNALAEDTSIHWHGILLPSSQDGVPGISEGFSGIAPGGSFHYRFPLLQSGTYWYHSHSGFQEQTGAYGAIVVEPREPEPFHADRDYVVLLSDWSDEDPRRIYAKLKKESHYYNLRARSAGDLVGDLRSKGLRRTWRERAMWNQMRMSEFDLSDVTGATYTFLMNGAPPAQGWTGLFARGERVRLRLINASAMTFFDLRIPGLSLKVVSADGQLVEPVQVEELRLGVAETYDVIVEPRHDRAYTIFAQALDRSGYARGVLTPDIAMPAPPIPQLDAPPILGPMDMGMAHGAHGQHAAHSAQRHGMHGEMPGMKMRAGMHEMHGGAHGAGAHGGAHGGEMRGMEMSGAPGAVRHAPTEFGPHVDMRAEFAQLRLDDPGPGLRGNGRRVLTYADLRSLAPTPDARPPERSMELHLTGNMHRYMWSIDGVPYHKAEPLRFRFGERLRIELVNDTMMSHPMHLHGMWSELETGDAAHLPRKHTVIVQPGARIRYLVTADAMGSWAYHCHLLYHMAGMFREVIVERELS